MPPRYKQEIEASGLSQKEWYAKVYLKSEHWRALKRAKAKEVGRKCEVCGATKKLEFHHDNYREIYDVTTADLRILCKTHHHEFHFGASKKIKRPDLSSLNFDSTNLEGEVLSLIANLKKSLRNQRLNLIIKEMRKRSLSQSAINPIIALKSGKKARLLRLSMNGGKWRTEDFEVNWKQFIRGKQITRELIAEFCTIYKANIRTRHIRKLDSIASNLV